MTNTPFTPPHSEGPTGPPNSAEPRRRGRNGTIIAAVVAVAAVLVGIGIGRSSVTTAPEARAVAASTAPAPTPSTVTATVTSIVSSTITADPTTVTETPAPVTVTPPATTVKQTARVTVTESAAGPTASIPDGISLVGVDVQAGTYKSTSGDCYFARLSGTSNELDDIITNGNGATIVTIDPSDKAFESRYCGTWTKVE